MADHAEVSGPLRDWLAVNREDLNARFKSAKRRYAKLEPQTVLQLVAELLPPAIPSQSTSDAAPLLDCLYDLILLHAGRGLLGDGAPLRVLLADTFPKLSALLAQRPRQLPSALSNAVENLGSRGTAFARVLSAMSSQLTAPEQALDAGALLAWRLGEARLRDNALKVASQLPNRATLEALDLNGWPDCAAPLAVAALLGDAWTSPRERVSLQTLDQLDRMPRKKVLAILEKLAAPGSMPLPNWSLRGTCGEFEGFGGNFDTPPLLLNAGAQGGRHRFWVRSGVANYRIDADLFGWVCKPDPAVDYPIQETARSIGLFKSLGLTRGDTTPMLLQDGTLHWRGASEKFAALGGASSFNTADECVAATLADSFRVRIVAAVRPAQ